MKVKSVILLTFLPLLSDNPLSANQVNEESARLYTSRKEQRETGIKHKLTPWLTLAGLAEADWESKSYAAESSNRVDREQDPGSNLQLAINIDPNEMFEANIVYEYDSQDRMWTLDEGVLTIEVDDWELTLGKHDLAFGEFFSNFATGPILELGEIKQTGATLSYELEETIKFSFSAYRSSPHKIDSSDRLDFGFSITSWLTDDFSFGLSYLSDLADSDRQLLDDFGNVYEQRISGMSTYFLWVKHEYELSIEVLGATGKFSEFESDRNQPWAWNIELSYCISPSFTCAFRLEGSQELQDEPEIQGGVALNYRLYKYASLSFDMLHGRYKGMLATDENSQPYKSVNTVAAQLSIAF